ncbi:MAG: DUF4412 domain-containing protein [Prolixibacteraceae bacterium]|nr:DUF4412 domain-containing protein [Prolixibacteraceae bacterium]
MKKSFLLLLPIMLLLIIPSQAQILRNIARGAINSAKNSAEDRVEKEVDKKVENEVNKLFDKALEKNDKEEEKNKNTSETEPSDKSGSSSSNESQDMSNIMKKLGVSTEEVKHKDNYKFNSQIVTLIEVTDASGKKTDPMEYQMCLNESTSDMMMKVNGSGNSSTTIIDVENSCMLVLTDSEGRKSGFASKFDPNAKTTQSTEGKVEEGNTETEDCKMAKTGNSKSISGYQCKEYKCETNDEISIAWVTKDISANNNKIFKNSSYGSNFKTEGFEGMVIQYEFKSKKDKSSSVTTVKSIDLNKSSSFSTTGYSISGFSFTPKK